MLKYILSCFNKRHNISICLRIPCQSHPSWTSTRPKYKVQDRMYIRIRITFVSMSINETIMGSYSYTLAMYTRIFVRKTLMPKNPFLCSKSKYIACGIYSSNFLYQLIQQWLSHYNVIFIT